MLMIGKAKIPQYLPARQKVTGDFPVPLVWIKNR
jgi:hypothetical protein